MRIAVKHLIAWLSRASVPCLPLALVVPLACGGEDPEPQDGVMELSPEIQAQVDQIRADFNVECPQATGATYSGFGQPFMSDWCLECHSASIVGEARNGAPEDVNYDTQAQIQSRLFRIYQQAASNTPLMPPLGGPNDVLRDLLGEWLVCGAP